MTTAQRLKQVLHHAWLIVTGQDELIDGLIQRNTAQYRWTGTDWDAIARIGKRRQEEYEAAQAKIASLRLPPPTRGNPHEQKSAR